MRKFSKQIRVLSNYLSASKGLRKLAIKRKKDWIVMNDEGRVMGIETLLKKEDSLIRMYDRDIERTEIAIDLLK